MAARSLLAVLKRSATIMNATTGRFSNLSMMLLLPFAFFLSNAVTPALFDVLINRHQVPSYDITQNRPTNEAFFAFAALAVFLFVSCLWAMGSITRRAFHRFHGPDAAKLGVSGSSGFGLFFRLLGTVVISRLVELLVGKGVGLIAVLGLGVSQLVSGGGDGDVSTGCMIGILAIDAIVIVVVLVYLQVLWSLAFAVVVAESRWGWNALMRSSELVKGMRVRGVVLSLMVLSGVASAMLGSCSWFFELAKSEEDTWANGALTALVSVSQMVVMVWYTVAITVVYCEAANEEVSGNMDYVKLGMEGEDVEKGSVVVASV